MIRLFTKSALENYVEDATRKKAEEIANRFIQNKIDVIIESVARELVGNHEFERIKEDSPWSWNRAHDKFEEVLSKAAGEALKGSFFEQQVELLEEKIKEPLVIKALVKGINEYQVKGG